MGEFAFLYCSIAACRGLIGNGLGLGFPELETLVADREVAGAGDEESVVNAPPGAELALSRLLLADAGIVVISEVGRAKYLSAKEDLEVDSSGEVSNRRLRISSNKP